MANIYVGTILDTPFGITLDLSAYTADEMQEQLDTLIKQAQTHFAEEIEVKDWDSDEIPRSIAKSINPELWAAWMDAYDEHGDALLAFIDNEFYNGLNDTDALDDAISRFEDVYQGEYRSKEDFAQDWLENTGELDAIPEHLRYYFDHEAYARDMFVNDVYELDAPGGGIFVYFNR